MCSKKHDADPVLPDQPPGIGKADIRRDERPSLTSDRRPKPIIGPTVHLLGKDARGIPARGNEQLRHLQRQVLINLEANRCARVHDAFRIDCIVKPRTASAA